jgi:hypothetical protein
MQPSSHVDHKGTEIEAQVDTALPLIRAVLNTERFQILTANN